MTRTITPEEYHQMQSRPGRRGQRIRVSPQNERTYNGQLYASKAEMVRAQELDVLIRNGEVREVVRQPTFRLGAPENRYVADFLVVWASGRVIVEDVKGMRTEAFKRHERLWAKYGRLPLEIRKARKGRTEIADTIAPGRTLWRVEDAQ